MTSPSAYAAGLRRVSDDPVELATLLSIPIGHLDFATSRQSDASLNARLEKHTNPIALVSVDHSDSPAEVVDAGGSLSTPEMCVRLTDVIAVVLWSRSQPTENGGTTHHITLTAPGDGESSLSAMWGSPIVAWTNTFSFDYLVPAHELAEMLQSGASRDDVLERFALPAAELPRLLESYELRDLDERLSTQLRKIIQ